MLVLSEPNLECPLEIQRILFAAERQFNWGNIFELA
jgi:hypothetical protein